MTKHKAKTNKTPQSLKDIKVNAPEVILGVHSNVPPTADLTDGHAWITVTTDGVTQFYGLWPPSHPLVIRNHQEKNKSHVRKGYEAGQQPVASRYYKLNSSQQLKLHNWIEKESIWGYTHTCASWASETVQVVVGDKHISSSEILGLTGTPRELSQNILELEKKSATSKSKPIEYKKPKSSL